MSASHRKDQDTPNRTKTYMHHPGPPRFVAAGDEIELAPRDPEPTASYRWQLVQTPDDSNATVGDDPVEQLVPDVPGTYVAELTAPDGTHRLTIRAFPSALSPAGVGGTSGASGGQSGQVSGGVSGGFSGGKSGSGSYGELGTREKGAGGRPRLTLTPVVEDDEVVVKADPEPHPNATETAEELSVEFLLDDRDDIDPSAATVTDSTTTSGVVIPGDFYAVDIRVVDPDGEPLKSVDWVMSAGVFPTAAKIDEEGFGTLWLLAVEYQAFMGVAERDDGNVDYTWYSRSEEQDPINPIKDDSGTIVLEPAELKGMFAGGGPAMGGFLG